MSIESLASQSRWLQDLYHSTGAACPRPLTGSHAAALSGSCSLRLARRSFPHPTPLRLDAVPSRLYPSQRHLERCAGRVARRGRQVRRPPPPPRRPRGPPRPRPLPPFAASRPHRSLPRRCPHRLAPLSEGRVDKEGRLECPYHGWSFNGDGSCATIPQEQPGGRGATQSPRACVQSYMTQVSQGASVIDQRGGPKKNSSLLPRIPCSRERTPDRSRASPADNTECGSLAGVGFPRFCFF